MRSGNATERRLHATLCEVERGLFHARYRGNEGNSDWQDLPTYQLGLTVADAKRKIELAAKALGYRSITWEEFLVADVPPPPVTLRRTRSPSTLPVR